MAAKKSKTPSRKTARKTPGSKAQEGRLHLLVVRAMPDSLPSLRAFFSGLPRLDATCILLAGLESRAVSKGLKTCLYDAGYTLTEAVHGQALEPYHVYLAPYGKDLRIDSHGIELKEAANPKDPEDAFDQLVKSLTKQKEIRVSLALLQEKGSGISGLRRVKKAGGCVLVPTPGSGKRKGLAAEALQGGVADAAVAPGFMGSVLARYVADGLPGKRKPAPARETLPAGKQGIPNPDSELKYQAILRTSLEAFFLMRRDGTVLEVNQAACDLFGYTETEFRSLNRDSFIDPENGRLRQILKERDRKGWYRGEVTAIRKNGERFAVEFSSVRFKGSNEEELYSSMLRDISLTKRALRENELLVYNTEEAYVMVDSQLNILSFNNRFQRLCREYAARDVSRGSNILDYSPKDRRPALREIYRRVLQGVPETSEVILTRPDGGLKYISVRCTPARNESGDIIGAFVSATDITSQRESESREKKTLQLLRQAESVSGIGSWELDLASKQMYWSDGAYRMFGYEPDSFEISYEKALNLFHPDDRERSVKAMEQAIEEGSEYQVQKRFVRADGQVRHLVSRGTLIRDASGRAVKLAGLFHDITDMLESRQRIEETEILYRSLFDQNPVPLWIFDTDTLAFLEVNNEAIRRYGYSREEFLGMTIRDIRPPADIPRLNEITRIETENSSTYRGLWRHLLKDGTEIQVEITSHLIDYKGRRAALVLALDVTERQEALERIQQSEADLAEAQRLAKLGSWHFDFRNNRLTWSAELYHVFGIDRSGFQETHESFIGLVDEQDRDLVLATSLHTQQTGDPFRIEYHITTPAGERKVIQEYGYGQKDEQGQIVRLFGTAQDITERKQAEEALRQSYERFEYVTRAVFDAIWDWEIEADRTYYGDGYKMIYGWQPDEREADRHSWSRRIHPQDQERVLDRLRDSLLDPGITHWVEEYRFRKENGDYTFVRDRAVILRNPEGRAIRMIGASRDITENRYYQDLDRLEKEILESNASGTLSLITVLEKYLIGMEQLHPGMMCSLLEVRNGRMYNLAAPSLPETYLAAIQGEPIGEQAGSCGTAAYLRRRVVVGDIEQDPRWEKYRSPALRHGLRACWSQPILDEKGDVIVTFASYYRVPRLPGELEENTIQRATHILKVLFENNRRQQAIRESNERYEYVTQATFDAIWDWDLSRDSLYWGEGYGQLFGYRRDQSAGTQAERYRLIHPEDSNRISDSIAQAILDRNRVNWSGEYRYRHAQGTYAYVIDRAVILRDPDGTAIRMIGAVQDITQLKEAELRLLRERNTMRAIIDNIPDYVYVLDAQGRYIVNNKAMVEYLGCGSEADSLGKTLSECIPDDLARRNQEDDRRLIATGETVYNREESVISPDGETQWMLTTKVPLKDETGRITGLVGVTRNVNFIYKRRQEEKLIYDIVGAIGKNDSFNIALADTIRIIGSSLGFRLGEAWVLNPGKTELVRKACWFDARPGETHHFAYQPNIPAGKGLIGHTWESAQVQIWNDIFHNGVFLRAEQAEKAGLTSGVGIPVIFQEEVLAVLVFLNDRPISREDESIRMLQRIALQVGLDLQRKKTEDELNRFFNFAPELLCIAGPDGYFKKVNPAFTRLLGFSEQELTARPFTHFVHPDDLQETIRELGDATRGDMSHSFENRYRTKDGEWKWISWSSSPLLDEDGLVFGYGKDITQAKEAELNLLKFKNVIENSRDGIGIISLETPDVFMNQSFVDMLEYTPRELMEAGGALAVYVDPELGQRMFDSLFAGHYWNGDIQLRSRSGRLIDLYLSAGPVFNTSGKVIAVYGVHTDISPRKRMERELLEYNARIISILESITDGFFSLDRDWVVTYCNKEAEKLLATPKEEILGKNLWERYAEAIPLKFYSEYHRALQENIAVHFEEYYEPVKSWFEVSAYPSATGLSVFFRDVTERRRTEEELRISNERYRIVAQATNDSIWDWDLLTNVVYRPGRRLESSLGYGPIAAEDVDAFWQRHVHPEDWAKVLADRARILENKTLNYWDDEYRFRKPDGSYAIIFDRAYIIRDTGGRAIRMIGASRDITRERQQVIEITRIQQNLAALINSTSDLIWSLDADFRIITCNRAYSHLIQGFTGSPVREGDAVIQESFGSELVDRWRRFYQRALDGDSYSINEQLLEPRSGTMVDYIISFTPMTTPDGQVYGVACYAKDVTELVRSARQLEELNQRLRQQALELAASNKELEQFAYVASHDLQEPLRMVSSFLELIDKKYTARLDDTGRQYIRFAVNGAERMKQLIQNLLEFSRLGSAPEELADTDMNSVLDQVLETFRGRIQALGAQVESNRLPVLKRARKSQMLQLLQNLVSNALKYHGEAPPLVRIHAEDQGDHWLFSVADNGIGIDPKYAEKIFVIFQRLHNSTEYSGTGIGLSTCRKIVERHGGRIWVESEPGRGSTFYFTLPKQIPDRT